MSIGVFCNVSAQEYDLLQFTMMPLFQHPGVAAIVILHTGRKPPVNYGKLSHAYSKVREIHNIFGEGYELSVEDGGYNQLSARIYAIDEIEKDNTEWIIQFDADEFLTYDAIDAILSASDAHDIVACDYYTPLSRTEYWFEPRLIREVGRCPLIDPHILIWRRRLKKQPELCARTVRTCVNVTRHCSVSFANYPYWRTFVIKGYYHFHLHCLLGKKNAAERISSLPFPRDLPLELVECMQGISKLNI